MGPLIPSGSWPRRLLFLVTFSIGATYAQTPPATGRCAVTAVPNQVRAEGITERLGDILLQCTGSTPGALLSGNLQIFLPIAVTNRLDSGSTNLTHDVALSVDYGSGFVPTGQAGVVSANSISFNGINLTIPPSGNLGLRISNLRGAVFQAGPVVPAGLRASLSSSLFLLVDQPQPVIAYPQVGLYATLNDTGITCVGSPQPSTVTVANLFGAGTAFASTRITEGFAAAFQPRGPNEDNGTRILVNYSGFPAGTHLYLPDAIAGSDADIPTSGGDLGYAQSPGQYTAQNGGLLLLRVFNSDANGAGGMLAAVPSGPLSAASEVPLTAGAGYAVYEVADARAASLESAQFPTFIGLSNVSAPAVAQESISFAPVSNVTTASSTAPIQRFVASTPPSDCKVLSDCNANYFPRLSILTSVMTLTGAAGGAMTGQPASINIRNNGGGLMNWTASIAYVDGNGWLRLETTSGQQVGNIRVFADPSKLAAGTYHANVTVDAGMGGSQVIPVTLTVSPSAAVTPAVVVSQVINAATYDTTPLVAGSLGTLKGSNLSGKNVSVTFDGTAATVLYDSDGQINFQVPAALSAKTASSLIVTVDGVSSAPRTVALSPAWPSIFAGGVLNPGWIANNASAPVRSGSYLTALLTGIPDGATVSVQLGDRKDLVPMYAGAAPNWTGIQQVNVGIPADLAAGTTTLVVCATTGAAQYCSAAYLVAVTQ
jgi:uncharacterized protein (TIGR03437 family)